MLANITRFKADVIITGKEAYDIWRDL